jgi:YggT family protein
MGVTASLTLPVGDAITSVETFIDVFVTLYGIVLLAYVVTSWVRIPYSPTGDKIQRFLFDVSVPYLAFFRRLLPMAGPLDFSPIVAFIALGAIDRILHVILDQFH